MAPMLLKIGLPHPKCLAQVLETQLSLTPHKIASRIDNKRAKIDLEKVLDNKIKLLSKRLVSSPHIL